uniref:Ig-like domain-containing protein n=1 Tax=Astatotilapia calliptera TaxID=8154 RepID=A0A3P8NKP9_ASTCA
VENISFFVFLTLNIVNIQINITAGQNVTLPCRAPNIDSNSKAVVEWSRADLGKDYVLLYRDEQPDPEEQHPSFKNRVDLQDREMKDGDVSLILKDVTTTDAGIYECRVFSRGGNRRKRANLKTDPISIINLSVMIFSLLTFFTVFFHYILYIFSFFYYLLLYCTAE